MLYAVMEEYLVFNVCLMKDDEFSEEQRKNIKSTMLFTALLFHNWEKLGFNRSGIDWPDDVEGTQPEEG